MSFIDKSELEAAEIEEAYPKKVLELLNGLDDNFKKKRGLCFGAKKERGRCNRQLFVSTRNRNYFFGDLAFAKQPKSEVFD